MTLSELLEHIALLHPSATSARVRLTNKETLEFSIDAVDYSDGVVSFICDEKDSTAYDEGWHEGYQKGLDIGREEATRG